MGMSWRQISCLNEEYRQSEGRTWEGGSEYRKEGIILYRRIKARGRS